MLTQPCHVLPGVGESLSKLLAKCGIETIQDVLLHLPYRYQDRTRVTAIRDLRPQDWAVVVGDIVSATHKQGRRPTLECVMSDRTGHLRLRFFHFYAAQLDQFQVGQRLWVFGEVRTTFPSLEMVHPEYHVKQQDVEVSVDETLTPIYSVTQGLSQKRLRQIVQRAFSAAEIALQTFEWMEPRLLERLGCYSFEQAIRCLHSPPPDMGIVALENGTHPALKRLVYEELLAERLSMAFAKQTYQDKSAPACPIHPSSMTCFLNALPFQLTGAQRRVSEEIAADLAKTKPMMRLVQGDVGSGKTVVSALAALQVIQEGYQVALMAPTELLSEQHSVNFTKWFAPLGIVVKTLSGGLSAKTRKAVLESLQLGTCNLLIGTHALFQEKVQFHQLGLVMIDEQHRFGVSQRLALLQKGAKQFGTVHQLLMTATPIPRTLKMTQWSYLDVSVIDELPPSRTPVVTAVMSQDKRGAVLERLQQAIASGRQTYWVCPFIEASEKLECQAAVDTELQLKAELPNIRIGLMHGRMATIDKERTMLAFKQGELDLLVATTVIEVGVDVPNASLMIIENAERMGLAQLHQLRGRVGRGVAASYCILLYQPPLSREGLARLQTLRDTNDGFEIAEQDLKYRGGGELLGTRQTGYRQYKIVDLSRDHGLLPDVSKLAQWLMKTAPDTAKMVSERWKGEVSEFLKG
ncbi:MAG: ATP-dependent DNA helicase RecG [Gammaproteobacteria bacterium]|nr:ATP-dependent DNA helicase RecG [Gammaproteobacteria bacterium]